MATMAAMVYRLVQGRVIINNVGNVVFMAGKDNEYGAAQSRCHGVVTAASTTHFGRR